MRSSSGSGERATFATTSRAVGASGSSTRRPRLHLRLVIALLLRRGRLGRGQRWRRRRPGRPLWQAGKVARVGFQAFCVFGAANRARCCVAELGLGRLGQRQGRARGWLLRA